MLTALLITTAVVLGWLGFRWRAERERARRRSRLEDALKHLFEQEYRGRRASVPSLAGALRMRDQGVVALVGFMQTQGLLSAEGQEFLLTDEGRKLALQVVRAHRLLERYFADEARLPLEAVHAAAERGEHHLSPAEIERLSASLGHPLHDPHGDPIPGADGALAPPQGTPANAWAPGPWGRIVHLEDEPELSYAQIVAEGLRLGQRVRVVDAAPERILLSDGLNEFRLAPAVAANVFLAAAPEAVMAAAAIPLSDLESGARAEVVALDEACQGFSRRRLMDLGFTEGAEVRPMLTTFAGDPRAYEVRGTLIALRREQARQVLVKAS